MTSGCSLYKKDFENRVLYSIAHIFTIHETWEKCEDCDKILNSKIMKYHRAANCDDKKGADKHSDTLRKEGFL